MSITRVAWTLGACVAVVMTGFGIALPVLARRAAELGEGPKTLAASLAAFALGHALCAPLAGALADRIGRRTLMVLGALGFALANLGYLFATSELELVGARALAGILTSGMYPAALGLLNQLAPREERARHVAKVMAGYGAGFVLGPLIGGLLFDYGGSRLPFAISSVAGFAAAVQAHLALPGRASSRAAHQGDEEASATTAARPLLLMTLLSLDFAATFAFGLSEPAMAFYTYDRLGWSSTQFGAVVCAYGAALVVGQVALGGSSDRLGRGRVLGIGVALSLSLYLGLGALASFWALFIAALVAGVGVGLVGPALAALYLDVSPEQTSSRVMGWKSAASALGSFCGPFTLSIAHTALPAPGVFWLAAGVLLAGAASALLGVWCLGPATLRDQASDLVPPTPSLGETTSD